MGPRPTSRSPISSLLFLMVINRIMARHMAISLGGANAMMGASTNGVTAETAPSGVRIATLMTAIRKAPTPLGQGLLGPKD